MSLAWVVVVGVVGICLFAQMSGRVAAISGRATFEIIRERLGPRAGAANLGASVLITVMTLTAEVGGVALALQLASGVQPLLWIPLAAFAVWLVIWRVKFSVMENVAGLLGLTLVVFGVALFLLGPDWGDLKTQALQQTSHPRETPLTYWYYAIALFGAAMTPYEVFFFSSGGVEEKWTEKDLVTSRANVWSASRWAACCRCASPAARRPSCCLVASTSTRCRRPCSRWRWVPASSAWRS